MPKKTLFRSFLNYENGKSSSTAKKEALETPSTPSPSSGTAVATWTEAALEKANMAVLYDFTGSPKQALDAYNEAIELLDKVFEAAMRDGTDQSRLRKIYDSYMDRVSILTQQINNNELDATPTISIPIAQSPSSIPRFQPEKQSPPPSLKLDDSPSNFDSKAPLPPPPPIPNQSQKALPPPLPTPPTPTKSHKAPPPPKSPSGSLFGSMFLKKHTSKEHMKSPSPSSTTSNHPIFSMPAPSKSTPTLSANRSTKSWRKQASSKKKQRHSTEMDPLDTLPFTFSSSKLDLPSLTLPDVDLPKDDDYFDLQSTMETKHLLYSTFSEQQQPFTSLVDLHRTDDDNNNEADKYGNDRNHMVDKGYPTHDKARVISNNDSQQPVTSTPATTMTRSPSSSSSFSGNIPTKHHQPYPSSARNSSIYSPTRSSIYSTSTWADDYSITSSKHIPPQPSLLFLPEINATNHSTSSFFTDSTDFAIDDLTKFLADSAATMPDRSHQHHHQRTNVTPSIAAVVEEEPHELSSSPVPSALIDTKHPPPQSNLLARSPSSKSAASSSSSSSHSIHAATCEQPTPLPSNSSKSISFWNKRSNNKATKPKTFKTLAPLRTDHSHSSKSIDDTRHKGSDSLPTTPRSVATSIGQAFLSPTTPSKRPTITTPNNNNANTMPHHFFGVESAASMLNKGINVQCVFETTPSNKDNKQPKLMARLLQSMEEGGYITDRIHAPKQLWYQTQVRLPAIDAKITSCEHLLVLLQRMHTRTRHLDAMITDGLHDLGRLEHTLDQIKHSFGKSAPPPSHDHSAPTPHSSHSSSLLSPASSSAYQPASSTASLALPASTTQEHHPHSTHSNSNNNNNKTKDPMATWSSKWSKSVERIRMDTKSSEEQIHAYISTLIRLFSMASVLDEWRDTLMDMSRSAAMDKAYLYDHLLQKTMMCTGTLHTVVCSFVMQDLAILMNKWLKRNRDWLLDD